MQRKFFSANVRQSESLWVLKKTMDIAGGEINAL